MARLRITPEVLEALLHLQDMKITDVSFGELGGKPVITLEVAGENLSAEADLLTTFYMHDCGGDRWLRAFTAVVIAS